MIDDGKGVGEQGMMGSEGGRGDVANLVNVLINFGENGGNGYCLE